MRLIDADKLKNHYAWWDGGSREMTMDEAKRTFDVIVNMQPTVEIEQHITPQMFAEQMRKFSYDDEEMGHISADHLMTKVLEQFGYEEGIEIFQNMGKWYS